MNDGMTSGGWIFMTLSWGFIIGLTVFCFYKLLRTTNKKD